jgi:outer membrane receptor for ferrienterochelin and colicins
MSCKFRLRASRHIAAPSALVLALSSGVAFIAAPVRAQQASPSSAGPAPAPAPTPPGDAQKLDRVEIRGARETDAQQRQRSTASKIIVGREEIERYGDATVGELLRRLPGVTQQGAPGRGGRIAMRGMGSYTQILLDGQRVPPGFSLDSLNPDQIERIEILRAPTAETGARAIAGTINIVTREGFVRRLNDLVASVGMENDRWQPGLSWTRNDSVDRLTYNLTASINRFGLRTDDMTTTVVDDPSTGSVRELRRESGQSSDTTDRTSASGRLQWRLDNGSLMLAPFLLDVRSEAQRATRLEQLVGSTPPLYATSDSQRDSAFSLARLNTLWRHRFAGGANLESRLNYGEGRSRGDGLRREFDGAGGLLRTIDDDTRARQRGGDLGSKLSFSLGDGHALVTGVEGESSERRDSRRTLQDGVPQATDFGENLEARSTRLAAYAQDEWNINPNWAAHAGLRWEGIATRGGGDTRTETNRSSVWSPLLHGVWKPRAAGRDQVRMSLTRSYRSPSLNDLIARPFISARYPVSGSNTPTSPDRAGNPALRPELATGIDLAAERYLAGGGLFSANVFVRRIEDLMRTVTTLETVSWSTQPRWVARPQNVGDATTMGLELEAKFRLAEFWAEAPLVDVRANASAFRSRVTGIPGPDNRLDQQPDYTGNLGADWRPHGTPLMLGASVNYTPGYDTRLSAAQTARVSRKRAFDAYAQWTVSPRLRLRLTASNLAPLDYTNESALVTDAATRETTRSEGSTQVAWRLRAEFKL